MFNIWSTKLLCSLWLSKYSVLGMKDLWAYHPPLNLAVPEKNHCLNAILHLVHLLCSLV